jgi:DNA helicase II / ATP-dependent DNA helicase PcrA
LESLNFENDIERLLLPEGCYFTKEQRQVIDSEGNANIIAGPGCGKTTVLIAKIASLIKQNTTKKGICVITHTNVAVDEIKTQLKKVGINEIKHPNFIGTIHEFFNYFFTYKAFQELFPGKEPTLLDEDDFVNKYKLKFEKYRTDDYRGAVPVSKMKENFLLFTQDNKVDLRFICSSSYKDTMLKSLLDIISDGEIRHNDTLSLAEWYINKYMPMIKKAFSTRFLWLILDEAQDTSKFQFELINKIVDIKEVKYQKYGDPYQALYNMYESNSEDGWIPYSEQNIFQPLELYKSARFGNRIASILKTTCIEKYSSFEGNPLMESFKPHLIIYNNKKDVIPAYLNIIEECYSNNNSFKDSKKKIAIVGAEHAHLKEYKNAYEKPKNLKIKTEGIIRLLHELTVKNIYIYLRTQNFIKGSFYEFKYKIKDIREINSRLSVIYREVIINKGNYCENSIHKLKTVLEILFTSLFTEKGTRPDFTSVQGQIMKETLITYQTFNSSEITSKEIVNEEELFFGTVHAVKGETHKATLLIDSSITEFKFTKNEVTFNLVDLIFEYLTGEFIEYKSTSIDLAFQKATEKALKIAYVALSRPTHLACVAVIKEVFGDNLPYVIDKSTKLGWEVKVI